MIFNSKLSQGNILDVSTVYMVVADEEYGRQMAFAFLERVKEEFKRRYWGKVDTALANSLDKEFGSKL